MGLIMMSYMMVLGGIYLIFALAWWILRMRRKLEYFYRRREGQMEKHYSDLR